jgi:radical SAM-linked protein
VRIEDSNENLGSFGKHTLCDEAAKPILVLVGFKVCGLSRFLSHAETLRVFQRACIRAGMNIQYSQGFNPRPRLSLPLPRSVGVESDDELLCVRVNKDSFAAQNKTLLKDQDYKSEIKERLSKQLPEGLEVISVRIVDANCKFQPISATYVLPVEPEYIDDSFRVKAQQLLSSESLYIERFKEPESKFSSQAGKKVNVRPFLESIEFNKQGIVVQCKISPAGSMRVDEILKLLRLNLEKLASPIRRVNVRWQ